MTRTPPAAPPARPTAGGTWLVAVLLAAHVALAVLGLSRTSVTFDENLHVPAGVAYVAQGDPAVSGVNPPLVKALFGMAALAAGARPPAPAVVATHEQWTVGEAFMRANAAVYRRVYTAARLVNVLLSAGLALTLWALARTRWGDRAGLLALAAWALAPEALAHAGVATMDVATAWGWLALTVTTWRFLERPGLRRWLALAAVLVAALLVRFTFLLFPLLALVLAGVAAARRSLGAPVRVALGVAALLPVAVLAIDAAYLGHVSFAPLAKHTFESKAFTGLQQRLGALPVPLPDAMLAGLDRQSYQSEPGHLTTYFLGRATGDPVRAYFPVAIALKWPLALLALLALGALSALGLPRVRSAPAPGTVPGIALLASALVFALPAIFGANLNAGVRYLLPLLPLGALAASRLAALPGRLALLPAVLAAGLAVECALAAPWWLSSFNVLAGPPERAERLLNDSNVDWGQGLVALKDELRARGIGRIHLAYHGTVDPAIYGIDYVPYTGGMPGTESDWIAVSSYFWVGLPARMLTSKGYSDRTWVLDFQPLWSRPPVARPGRCMLLYRLR